ncbi:lysophospholipid acyltransferase family protein [Ectothiorhodospiraceae bacterium WFHF3C12]|nr:lysophospholipid acyltransferase family protein [Ectothiorhodospiraceae bacterium WFHF3C12]
MSNLKSGSRLAAACLRLAGWRLNVDLPDDPRYVLVVAPHTSNWDFVVGFAAKIAVGLQLKVMAKHTLFRGLFGRWLRWMGCLPVDRRAPRGFIGQMADAFDHGDYMVLAITPEGTRSYTEYWKSGFYHIARAAGVPIVLASLDYGARVVSAGERIETTGDMEADMALIRAYYEGKQGKRPSEQGPVRFRPSEEKAVVNG